MAQASDNRGVEDVRRDLERERDGLASATEALRQNIEETKNFTGKMRSKLPIVAGGALAAGFVLSGGVGATARLMFRRSREGATVARIGNYRIIED